MMTRILVVDDDDFFGQMLMDWLQEQGYTATRVTTAEAALEMAQQANETPEIFLVDERLGSGLSGVELITQLRQVAPESDAILFTGAADPDIARQAYLAGAWRYLRRPFDPNELGYILEALQKWRSAKAAQFERDWLHTLNQIVEHLQQANTVKEVGRTLVEGCIALDFDRARFYRVRRIDGEPVLYGICQGGTNQAQGFEQLVQPLAQTCYSKAAFEKKQATFFYERELGRGFLCNLPHSEGQPENLGEWVIISLFSGDECIGFLNMDNCRKAKAIHPQQKELLRLFVGQATVALERVLRYERDQQEHKLDEMVGRILDRMGDPAEKKSLDRLLHAIRDELAPYTPIQNFMVVFKSRDTDGYFTRLHIENAVERNPYWRPNSERGMIWCVLNYGTSLFIPQVAQEHREKYGLLQVGTRAARSWMAAVLRIGAEATGALIAEDDEHEDAFRQEHFDLLTALADRLAGVIQTAWLHEQEKEHSYLLHQLQEASELIFGFDEEKLWRTTLTLCTANYGASFDRAMLFLTEEGGTRLRGRMAIGHIEWEEAKTDWEEDVRIGMNWEGFLDALQVDTIQPTSLDKEVRDYAFAVGNGDSFAEVLRQNEILTLSKAEAQERLPADFLARFQATDYCLVPVKAGEQMMGVVVLDNIWEKNPNRVGVLGILRSLFNQAALLAENLRKSKALEDLVAVQHEVLVQTTVRPLQETLQHICGSIQSIVGADLVTIYPMRDDGHELFHDQSQTARVGRRSVSGPQLEHALTGLSKHVLLEKKQPVFIESVQDDQTAYCGERRVDARIVKNENIQATMAVPILGLRTDKPRGILYADYRTRRRFSEHDRRIAESFAHLIATAIGNWRDTQGLRDTQEARDEELRKLSQVLAGALEVAQNEDLDMAENKVIGLLLEAVPSLFGRTPVTAGITLKRWERRPSDKEPMEMHDYLYAQGSGIENRRMPRENDKGINSRAMASNTIQNVPDVRKDPDYRPRVEESKTLSELDVPIDLDGQVIGALNIESPTLAAFTPHHQEMAERFAHVATLALGNVRRQRNLSTVLNAVKSITAPAELPVTLRQIAESVQMAVPNLSSLTIWYKQPHNGELTLADSYFGVANREALMADYPQEDGMVRYAMTLHNPLWISNVMQNQRFASKKFVEAEDIRSTVVFPLRAQDEAVGVMFFSYRSEHIFTDEEKRLYPILAEVAAASIQDARLLSTAQRERKRFELALDITKTIGAELDLEEVTTKILNRLKSNDLFPNTTPAILLYNKDQNTLEFTPSSLAFYKPDNPDHENLISIPLDEQSIAGAVGLKSQLKQKKMLTNIGYVHKQANYLPARLKTNSQMSVTLYSDVNGLIGILVLESDKINAFDRDAEELARSVAGQLRLAVERAHQREELEFTESLAAASAWSREIAHDISQEILEIRYWADSLLYRDINPEIKRGIEKIDEAAQRLAGASLPERQKSEVIVLDRILQEQLTQIVQEQDSTIHLDISGLQCRALQIETYPFALERIFRHLVRNSRQAMDHRQQNEKQIKIATHLIDGDKVEIEYNDNGPGFPAHLCSKVFRTRLPNEQDSHRGVGLLLVRFIVEQLGGSIRLASNRTEQEVGLRFLIRLPNKPPHQDEEEV